MRWLIFIFLFIPVLAATANAQKRCRTDTTAPEWQGGGGVVVTKYPTITQAVYTSTLDNPADQAALKICPRAQWNEIDVSSIVPEGTIAVFLQGLLIITHGQTNEVCDLMISFRLPGDDKGNPAGNYMGQVTEAQREGGQRSTFASWVPVSPQRRFEFWWTTATPLQPMGCTYGVNLKLQAYTR